jgi:hypothetical protein
MSNHKLPKNVYLEKICLVVRYNMMSPTDVTIFICEDVTLHGAEPWLTGYGFSTIRENCHFLWNPKVSCHVHISLPLLVPWGKRNHAVILHSLFKKHLILSSHLRPNPPRNVFNVYFQTKLRMNFSLQCYYVPPVSSTSVSPYITFKIFFLNCWKFQRIYFLSLLLAKLKFTFVSKYSSTCAFPFKALGLFLRHNWCVLIV